MIQCYETNGSCGDAIFEAGEMLKGNIDAEEEEVFGKKKDRSDLELFVRAVTMHDSWCDVVREACVAWILIAKRIRLNKDVRKMISVMVWETRREAWGVPLLNEAK